MKNQYIRKEKKMRRKKEKRIVSVLLTAVTVMGMGLTGFSQEALAETKTGTITIQNSVKDKEYNLYRIFDLTYSGTDNENVSYVISEKWKDFFLKKEGETENPKGASYLVSTNNEEKTLNPILVDGTTKYINIVGEKVTDGGTEAGNVAQFAQDALEYAVSLTADQTATGTGQNLVVSGLSLGYYLVYPKGAGIITEGNASICSLDSTTPDGSIKIKSEYPTLTKEIEKNTSVKCQSSSASIGDEIHFIITTTIPDMTGYSWYKFVIEDVPDTGITFSQIDSIVVGEKTLTEDDYKVENSNSGKKIIFTNFIQYKEKAGSKILVRYTGKINKNASIGTENKNSAQILYSNNPAYTQKNEKVNANGLADDFSGTDPKGESESSNTQTFSTALTIKKTDAGGNTLVGAQFQIEGKASNLIQVKSREGNAWKDTKTQKANGYVKEDGTIVFEGLGAGTYTISEITTPEGYNTMEDLVVTIAFDEATKQFTASTPKDTEEKKAVTVENNLLSTTIVNQSGSKLPSTGGIGTKLFYLGGSLFILGAGVALLLRKRTNGDR
jgi:fimbrial isopeptide formation D2 family protein/LPXTG-motif cell wall-anchored protein